MFKFFLQKKIESQLKARKQGAKSFLYFKQLKSVLILFDYENWPQVKLIAEDLRKEGKNVIFCTIKTSNIKSSVPEEEMTASSTLIIDSKADIKWTGVIKSEILNKLKAMKYETLLDLSSDNSLLMLYLKSLTRAPFSIGIKKMPFKFYDFVLLGGGDERLLEMYQHIKFYLSQNN